VLFQHMYTLMQWLANKLEQVVGTVAIAVKVQVYYSAAASTLVMCS